MDEDYYKSTHVNTKPDSEKDKITAPGYKEDKGKLRYDLLPPYALSELAKVYTYGADKYTDNNWRKGMKWGRIFGALMRHLWKFWAKRERDKESGILHLSHALWGVVTLLEYSNGNKYSMFDDRAEFNDSEHENKSKYYIRKFDRKQWRLKDGYGYTSDIKKAYLFTEEEVQEVFSIPGMTDTIWPESFINFKGGST